jgi:PAS domain S-box-containing protein
MAEQFERGAMTECAQRALMQAGVVLTQDPFSECTDCPLSDKYAGRGAITLRLEHAGRIYGILSVSIPREIVPDEEEHGLLEEVAGDIAFGLHSMELEEGRKRAEKARIESEETLREAQEIAHLGNWEYDIGEDRVSFSEELYRIYGVKPTDRPLTYEKLLEYVYAEDREYQNAVTELLRKEGAAEFEYRVLRPDGKMRWVWGRGQVTYDKAGVPLRMFGTLQDITGRKRAEKALSESEKRFRDLIESSLIGISIIQDNQVVYQNPEQERLLGPLPRSPKLADSESIHPDDVEKVREFYQKIISGEVQIQETDFRFYPMDEDGNKLDMKWVHCRASTIEYGGKKGILINMMDVTRTKQLEDFLRIQDKMSSLGRVAAGIAHEIRNPLSGINIYLGTLEKMYDKEDNLEKVKQIFGQLKSASDKIESVIRRVMDFSKPGEPKLVLTDINEPIEEAINLSSVTLRKRGIKLEKTLAGDLQPCPADPHLIEQVILNLITNAAEAMKNVDGAKIIEVTSSMENNLITVKICDSGPGIPSHLREKIFDPFYTTKNGSTGIGLSLSHRIITDHGGSFNVASSKWGGAEFRIEIPTKRGIDQI